MRTMADSWPLPVLANRSMHKYKSHKLPSSVRALGFASTHMYECQCQLWVATFRCTGSCDPTHRFITLETVS